MNTRRWWWLAVGALLLGAVLTVPFRYLWEVDEPRYAEAAREMITTGQWLVPHLYGEPYTQKPPLYIWLVGALRLTGLSWTAAGVLPALAALLGIVCLLPRLARATALDPETGRLAGVVLTASVLASFLALGARMDMLLALLHTVALIMMARLLDVGTVTRSKARAHILFWLAIGLGVLTKGPVALALPLVTALLAMALLRPRPSLRAVFVGWGPLVCLGVVLAWLVPAALAGGREYVYEIVVKQSAGRMANSFAHQQPFYFYLVRYPLVGLPWSVAAVVAATHALRRRTLDAAGFLSVAALAVIAFFSLVSGKLEIYLLPLLPPAALLVANAWQRQERGIRTALALGAAGMVVVGGAAVLVPRFVVPQQLPWPAWALVGVAVAGPALWALALAVRGRPLPAVSAALAASGLLVPAALIPVGIAALDAIQSTSGAAAALARAEPDAPEFLTFGAEYAGLWLYSQRPGRELADEAALFAELSSGRCVLVDHRRWSSARASVAGVVAREDRMPLRNNELILACGRPPAD